MISALDSGLGGTGNSKMSRTSSSLSVAVKRPHEKVKKDKRCPKRRCGSWCEFMSSKGKVYYFHIKKGITQWSKPQCWEDHKAYEPSNKKPKTNEGTLPKPENKENLKQSIEQNGKSDIVKTSEVKPEDIEKEDRKFSHVEKSDLHIEPVRHWSSSMTSLKSQIQQKMEIRRFQKTRRTKIIETLDQLSKKHEDVNLKQMLPLTSYQSMGIGVRELLSENYEKKADFLHRERQQEVTKIVELDAEITRQKKKIAFSQKITKYVNIRLENSRKVTAFCSDSEIISQESS